MILDLEPPRVVQSYRPTPAPPPRLQFSEHALSFSLTLKITNSLRVILSRFSVILILIFALFLFSFIYLYIHFPLTLGLDPHVSLTVRPVVSRYRIPNNGYYIGVL